MKKKLSKTQSKVVRKMIDMKWYSAYDLQCGISTLESLYKRGIVGKSSGLGSLFCPRTGIKFSLASDIEKLEDILV